MLAENNNIHYAQIHSEATLSGPSFRAFLTIAKLWKLSDNEAMVLLGESSYELYSAWLRDVKNTLLSAFQIKRVSYLLSIHHSLQKFLDDDVSYEMWLRSPNSDPLFQGISPIEFLLSSETDRLHSVLFYLS